MNDPARLMLLSLALALAAIPAHARLLWSDPGAHLIHDTGDGTNILGSALKRDETAADTLYFKFRVDPLSDVGTEEYYAGFQFFDGDEKHLAIGNSPQAWGYSAFYTAETGEPNKVAGDFDLHTSSPESLRSGQMYEMIRRGNPRTIVFKVQFVPGADDLVTVWLNPNLSRGAREDNQPEGLTTEFKANASFDQIRLRHVGNGDGWIFSDVAVATSFNDFIVPRFWQTWWFIGLFALGLLATVATSVRIVEKKKFQRRLQLMEQERALSRERARIAQDLHDDLGSSLTRISLLSDLAKADKDDAAQVEEHVEKISLSAAQSVRALEEIVWAVRPGSDSLQSLVEYIAHVANEMFAVSETRCRLDLPHDLPARSLPPEIRHNIFLIVKEALTNALKHASAREVHVHVKAVASSLEILVRDDGRGFTPSTPSDNGQQDGLGNMLRRTKTLGGRLEVQSAPGKGTTIRLQVQVPERQAAAM